MTHVDVVFDGRCGFCTRAAGWLRRLDRHDRIRLHPAQRPGVTERFALSEADVATAAWAFVDDDRHAGAAAIGTALDGALGVRLFSRLYRLPVLGRLQDRLYRWVATHRYLLRGVTPWCTTHPEDCGGGRTGGSCGVPGTGTSASSPRPTS